ncbi:MAG: 23S rRNA (pseudouridine(1915)-N(3))-methyltransferase RlmH [Clostridia bacterium]|nr:23S rRNA (pseudouridine(1915)-N(3))-methyltransferase RlmH [Clostridia bacterium]MBQ8793072.1 23S rRNA (pseudouridine(1915)-N(3))-methyltransferase RlmH [Clostridia bacterium]
MTVNLVCVGNLKEKFWIEASKEYEKRLSKFCKVKIIELAEQNKYDNIEKIKEFEGQDILNHLEGRTFLLDIGGKQYSSEEFAQEIEKTSISSSSITFVIGGSYGVSDRVKGAIKDKISFGRATYPHNLARIILLEQIYRAFMINGGGKYHK